MEPKDGSMGFDFGGTNDEIKTNELISYVLDDGGKVEITFLFEENTTKVTETFEPEDANPVEMQRSGWQAILYGFKKYVESR